MADQSTQSFLKIKDIREGITILDNGDMRGILTVSSMNFALKSEENQLAIIHAFQSFLNSLDFFCQIVVQSRNINITPYLETIKSLEENQANELLRTQISSYYEFIKELIEREHITTKNFYVVIPYRAIEGMGVGNSIMTSLFGGARKELKPEEFENYKNQLWQRMEFVASGLHRCGLDVTPLTSVELIDLFWKTHHPSQAEAGAYPEIAPELLR